MAPPPESAVPPDTTAPPLPAGTDHIPAVDDGPYAVRPGNDVTPLIGGLDAFRRIAEAVEAASDRVWVTVAFLERDVALPDGKGHVFDLLDRAVARGVDVRVLFWRGQAVGPYVPGEHFGGTPEDRDLLADRGSSFLARWDVAHSYHCHHQKSWLVDAGTDREAAFVGGINLGNGSVTAPPFPERPAGHIQDVYVELRGPASTDVHHNFVQRWNGASERAEPDGAWPSPDAVGDLPSPEATSPERGSVAVQITRTVRRGQYDDDTPTPGGRPFAVGEGEATVMAQYLAAIEGAREGIYLENQSFFAPAITEAVEAALGRGVPVVVVVPGTPSQLSQIMREMPDTASRFDDIAALGRHEVFTMAALAANRGRGRYEEVYVHSKVAAIDDVWATIGSTNIGNHSFYGDTEMNASFWDRSTAHGFRSALFANHLGEDTASLPCGEALLRFGEVARGNRRRRDDGESLTGHAYAIDPADYGR